MLHTEFATFLRFRRTEPQRGRSRRTISYAEQWRDKTDSRQPTHSGGLDKRAAIRSKRGVKIPVLTRVTARRLGGTFATAEGIARVETARGAVLWTRNVGGIGTGSPKAIQIVNAQ
jgi:hypothetical protein